MRMSQLVLALGLGFAVSSAAFAYSPFSLPQMNPEVDPRETYDSSTVENGIFVLEFYQLFCGGCNANAQNVNDFADEFAGDEQVQILAVGLDSRDSQYDQWNSRHNPNHPVLKASGSQLARDAGIRTIPTAVILDCEYAEIFRHSGGWSESVKAEMRSAIEDAKSYCQ